MHIYIHVPFCAQICSYCDFCKTEVASPDDIDSYLDALDAELSNRKAELTRPAETLYIGGGTPTRLGIEATKRFIEILDHHIGRTDTCEFSYEADPCTTTRSQMEYLYSAGVNRLSIGAQSWSPTILKSMSRLHQPDDINALVHELKDIGFCNISVDLIVGWPNQTEHDIMASINELAQLDCQHVSTYMLMVEPDTPLSERIGSGATLPLQDEDAVSLYHQMRRALISDGFEQYEISNFAKSGFISRHNQAYWHHQNHLGFGPGAVGLNNHVRRHNTRDINRYVREPVSSASSETLSSTELRNEKVMLSLRTASGVGQQQLEHVDSTRLQNQIDAGHLVKHDDRVVLNPEFYMVSNHIISELFHPQ